MNTPFPIRPSASHAQTDSPTLQREEIEGLLPDYAFGVLSAEEARQVEQNLRFYPDLAEEARAIGESFHDAKAEFEAIDRMNAQRLKNLSVHVQERLRKDGERRRRLYSGLRWVAPLAVAGALAVVVVLPRLRLESGVFPPATTTIESAEGGSFQSENLAVAHIFNQGDIAGLQDITLESGNYQNPQSALINETVVGSDGEEDDDKQTNLLARKMLGRETLGAIAANRSAFQEYFDASSSSLINNLSDDEAAHVAAILASL
jgi:hypothetical protein